MLNLNAKSLFPFDEDTIYLDHGGFGVTPVAVSENATLWREKIERNPRKFLDIDYQDSWKAIAEATAKRFAAKPNEVALVENTTDGINAILRSRALQPNDEILILSLAYGAIAIATRRIAKQYGVRVVEAQIHYPDPNPKQCVDAVTSAITPRTKLAILDHITSKTALVLPIKQMTDACHEHGVMVIVDGAHAPGQVALDVPEIGADWYVGNLHKWYFVPRGCGFLWARPDRQQGLIPSVLSWETDELFPRSFSWTGTHDPSSWLSIPSAFKFMDQFGEENIRQHNDALILQGMSILATAWDVNPVAPESMIGSMCLVPLPKDIPYPATDQGRFTLQKILISELNITCPCILQDHQLFVRISAQIYNQATDYERLACAINAMCAGRTRSRI